ncbi:MAG TPA: hypothetical protein VGR28_15045 [Candidatus Thermoplasmatota archaeon]|jgi:predicted RNA-binding Zn-ribbon protein involved in translation (DUF1610 family)|nr:hypothetical protein [Candidatus Thermoplasmatota archaeon]
MECPKCGLPLRLAPVATVPALNEATSRSASRAVPRWTCDNDACGWTGP